MDIDRILKKILEIDDLVSKKHDHSNKSIIDTITQALINNWNNAYTHISDTVKHITSTERTNWNDADSKKHTHSNKSILDTISQINLNTWNDKYSKNEVDNKINQVIINLDWKEAVNSYEEISTTYPNPDNGWTVSVKNGSTYRYNGTLWEDIGIDAIPLATSTVDGKMSKQDKIDHDDMNGKKHTHNNKTILDIITQTLIDNWNAAYTHISDNVKHITSTERSNWNSVSNKVDKITGKSLSTNDFDNNYKSKVDGISSNANKVETSTTNGNIKIDSVETTVYTHPTGTNPHGTTKSDIGLGNVDNTNDLNKPVSTATQAALNGKANSSHTHTKANITDFPTKLSQFSNDSGFITQADVDTSQNHTHSNKSVLDKITQALLDNWNSAYSHISDTIKHITSDERSLWNTVSNKLDKSGGTVTGAITVSSDSEISWNRNTDYAKIRFQNTGDSDTDSYMEFKTGDNGNEYFKFNQVNGSTTTELMTIKSDQLRFKGNNVYHTGNKPSASDIGLGNVDNTSDLNKPISNAVQTALNSKANSSHTHDDRYYTEAEINTKLDGKSDITHTHNYAGSSSAGGSANSSVKLATARKINLNGDVIGSTIFDGSEDVSITTSSRQIAFVGSDVASSNGWYKVASQTMSGYGNTNIMFAVYSTYGNYCAGILELQMRTDNTTISCRALTWFSRYGFNINHFIVVISGMTWTLYAYRDFGQYGRLAFEILSSSSIGSKQQTWILNFSDNNSKEATTPTATITSSDGATVNYANSSGSATKATQDSDGKQINTTYVKKGMTWNDLEGV